MRRRVGVARDVVNGEASKLGRGDLTQQEVAGSCFLGRSVGRGPPPQRAQKRSDSEHIKDLYDRLPR
jgi:hypothetical protein